MAMMALLKPTDELTLVDLLSGLVDIDHTDNRTPRGLKIDSRKVCSGDLFLACRGEHTNGAQFIDEAIAAGACAVLVDAALNCKKESYPVPVIRIENLSANAGIVAHRFYKAPSETLHIIGITGTNGKTSVSQFVAMSLEAANSQAVGIIGTLGVGTVGKLRAGINTTPDALTIHESLAQMREEGIENVVMEVSSHALTQARVSGVNFDIGIFTNLSQDHLDYHGDMKAYANAKRQLFQFQSLQCAVINIDDEYGQQLKRELDGRLRVIAYTTKPVTSHNCAEELISAKITDLRLGSLSIDINSPWGQGKLTSKLTGEFNASNLLASLAALCLSGVTFTEALQRLSSIEAIPGRMECFAREGFAKVIVDYAHTPDALQKALLSLRNIKKGKLICVFGCGGNRDGAKRSLMGRIAEEYADQVILTNDNPRNEDPLTIIEQIMDGCETREKVSVIPDRAAAISEAIRSGCIDDVILIAGKGHETSQEIAGVRSPFSDRQLVRNLMEISE